jgi:BON domain-containing protein
MRGVSQEVVEMMEKVAAGIAKVKANQRVQGAVARMEDVPVLSRLAQRMAPPEPAYRRFLKRAWPYAATSGATFGFAYFFDKDRGRARRARTRDRVAGLARTSARKTRRVGRLVASDAAGMRQRWQHRARNGARPDDATLVDKIRSEVFGDPSIDTSRLNVNAEDGIVFVRGVADSSDELDRLERRIRSVRGVVDVRMLAHRRNAPVQAPAAAIGAGRGGSDGMRSQRA